MYNKQKLHGKYRNQKRFLINKVLYEIFKRNRNIIKKTPTDTKTYYFSHCFIQRQNDMDRTWEIMQITNVNDFLRSLVKSLKIKFLHPMRKSMRMLSFKMRNFKELKKDISDQQLWGFFKSPAFRNSRPEVFYKKVDLNNFQIFTGKHVRRSLFLMQLQA